MKNNIKRLSLKLCVMLCLAGLITCTKLEKVMLVSTGNVVNIQFNYAEANGKVIDLGEGITQYGHCYAKTPNVNIDCAKTQLGLCTETGDFTSHLVNLEPATKYYIKTYLSSGATTVYGKETSFSTTSLTVPILTTSEIILLTETTAFSGGNIINEGVAPVTERGVCWNASANPTINHNKTSDGAGSGSFTSILTGLSNNTNYYVRAYATNIEGTAYGNELMYNKRNVTPTLPSSVSYAASNVTNTTATVNGEVVANGSSTAVIFEYGPTEPYYYTISATPNLITGFDPTMVNAQLANLIPGTIYHFRIKAVNTIGTHYSDDLTFTTLQIPIAVTTAATNVTKTTVTLNGSVNALNASTTVTFQYGLTTAYGSTATADQNPVNGSTLTNVNTNISGLIRDKTYHFRVKAQNASGCMFGEDKTFITPK